MIEIKFFGRFEQIISSKLKRKWGIGFLSPVTVFLLSVQTVFGIQTDQPRNKQYIKTEVGAGDFKLFSKGLAADIVVKGTKEEYVGVIRAAHDLQKDVNRVTGTTPNLKTDISALSKHTIIIGTIGKSSIIDKLILDDKIDVSGIKGQWESFVIQVVNNPVPGVEKGLVIAGSDKRGTIYGIYDVSEKIGVSPWYYWADVPPKKKSTIAIRQGIYKQGPPSVQYRGIFINDEFNLVKWSYNTFGEKKFLGPEAHKTIFELLLRLKANYLWPGMHRCTTDFNTYQDNPRLADEYGIIMGTSHCEPMMRSVIVESPGVDRGIDVYDEQKRGPYDYTVNKEGVHRYFDENAIKLGKYENTWTLGIRGLDDEPMSNIKNENKVKLLSSVIDDQRDIINKRVNILHNKDVLQVFCPYKEVLDIYNEGLNVPEDVCLLWPDDNHGYLRQVLTPEEQKRSGGGGVYYHLSVWNGIGSFLWLDSTSPGLIWSEMNKAYQRNMKRMWIVNVGDIKPAEVNMEFFLSMAYDADKWNENNISDFYRNFAEREFEPEYGKEIADILCSYYQLAEAQRPEFSHGSHFSHSLYGDEAMKRIQAYESLINRAEKIYKVLPVEQKDAFYQLVLYKVKAAGLYTKAMIYEDRSYEYQRQGRVRSIPEMSKLSKKAFADVKNETEFYNKTMSNGKWNYIMNPWYDDIKIPKIEDTVNPNNFWSQYSEPKLMIITEKDENLDFSGYTQNKRFIDIVNTGGGKLAWKAKADENWIKLSKTSGVAFADERIWVDIDWSTAPKGVYTKSINFNAGYESKTVTLTISNPETPKREDIDGYVEAHGYIAIEAENFYAKHANSGCEWKNIPFLGRSGSSVSLLPSTAESITTEIDSKSPYLEYKIYFEKAGKRPLDVYRIPTWNLNIGTRLAISLDNNKPTIIGNPKGMPANKSARTRIEIVNTVIDVPNPGYHTLKIYMVDPSVAIDRIVIGNYEHSYFGPPESYNSNKK
ncbi:glycosyl hydrolase 115 family protein [Flavobacterium sp.]|uniref:glycosyl hydrolase 115 family protein n=1 Tax=Flavobacterium sp. TaxID=239 RepID=UPI003C3ECD55